MTQIARLIDDADTRPADPFAGQAPDARPRSLAATRIGLTNFRSYARSELRIETGPVVLAGANGTGFAVDVRPLGASTLATTMPMNSPVTSSAGRALPIARKVTGASSR